MGNGLRALYAELYRLLRSSATEALVKRIRDYGMRDSEANALRTLVRMQSPELATVDDILAVAKECSTRYLEFAFPTEGIGEIARTILARANSGEPLEATWNASDVTAALGEQRQMLFSLQQAVHRLVTKPDIDLKGVCPFCQGPLVEVLKSLPPSQAELRLRCRDQTNSDCQKTEWFVQNIEVKSP